MKLVLAPTQAIMNKMLYNGEDISLLLGFLGSKIRNKIAWISFGGIFLLVMII